MTNTLADTGKFVLVLVAIFLVASVTTSIGNSKIFAAENNTSSQEQQQPQQQEQQQPQTPSGNTPTSPPIPGKEPGTTPEKTTTEKPDNDCLFKPELSKCKSNNGECPPGFNQNEDGNCFPKHDKCPKGFHGHEDDETGRCIPDSVPCQEGYIRNPDFPSCDSKTFVCREHPELKACGGKGGHNDKDHDNNVRIIVNNIHKGSSGGSSHSLSAGCYDAIKTAWLGKIQRADDKQIDTFIDKCLGIQ